MNDMTVKGYISEESNCTTETCYAVNYDGAVFKADTRPTDLTFSNQDFHPVPGLPEGAEFIGCYIIRRTR